MDRQGIQPDDPLTAELPFVGVENVVGGTDLLNFDTDSRIGGQKSTAFRFDRRHVLYGKLRPYLNKVAVPDFVGRCSTELVPLLPRDGVDRDFLAHLLRRKETVEFVMASVTGSRMPRADMKVLMSMPVPFPSLDEQRRIAGILNRAARIECLHAQAGRHLRDFASALFVKMFGDPVLNPMGWQVKSLAELSEEFRYGTSKKCDDTACGDAVPILRIPNVVNSIISWSDLKFTSLGKLDLEKLCLENGDILFVRTNGNPDYIGRCAVFNGNRPTAYASYLIRARLKTNGIADPQYISNSFALPSMRQIILKSAQTTAGNYNISIKNLGGIRIPIPAHEFQQRFLATIAMAKKIANMTDAAVQASSTLSASLITALLEGGA